MILVQNNAMLPTDLVEKAKYLKEIGVQGFEIDGSLILNDFETVAKMNEILPIRTVCGGYQNWIGSYEEAERTQCISDIDKILEGLAKLNGTGIVVPAAWALGSYRLPKVAPERSDEDTFKVLSDSLLKLDEIAGKHGVKIYLEPLNRYQDFMINTFNDAKKLIEANDLKNTLVTFDLYHMNIEEDNLYESLKTNIGLVGHIHIAENHRYQPGSGMIDFPRIFEILKTTKYDGDVAFECRFRDETLEVFEQSAKFIVGLND